MVVPNGTEAPRWRLRCGWRHKRMPDGLHFFNDVRRLRVRAPDSLLDALTTVLALGSTPTQAASSHLEPLLRRLLSAGPLILDSQSHMETASLQRRQTSYFEAIGIDPEAATKTLHDSSALILGLGGIGSVVLQHLLAAGIDSLVLVDFDYVEVSDLSRQFIHDNATVGLAKLESAKQYVNSHTANAQVTCISRRITSASDVAGVLKSIARPDVAAICIDTPADSAFDNCALELWGAAIPFVHGAVMIQSGMYGPLFSAARGSPDPTVFSLADPNARVLESCFAPYNTIIGASMAAELIHDLVGAQPDYRRRTIIDWSRGEIRKLDPPDA